jgi:hypothetical protein
MSSSYPMVASGTIMTALIGGSTMVDSGPPVMAKKKSRKVQPSTDDDRVAVVVLKDSLEYREWLNGISRESLIPVASIVRDALAKWATQRGYPAPPDRRP